MNDISSPAFWSARYETHETPWTLDRVPSALDTFLRRTASRGEVLIPGCGSDEKVIRAFDAAGFAVTAIDFSPVAIEHAKTASSLNARVIVADFFQHDFGDVRFDLIYERTFLCALHPSRRSEYAARVVDLLVPGGLLAGIFFYGEESDPPPYPLTDQQAESIFAPQFRLTRSGDVPDSLPMFAGQERWQEWRRWETDH